MVYKMVRFNGGVIPDGWSTYSVYEGEPMCRWLNAAGLLVRDDRRFHAERFYVAVPPRIADDVNRHHPLAAAGRPVIFDIGGYFHLPGIRPFRLRGGS